ALAVARHGPDHCCRCAVAADGADLLHEDLREAKAETDTGRRLGTITSGEGRLQLVEGLFFSVPEKLEDFDGPVGLALLGRQRRRQQAVLVAPEHEEHGRTFGADTEVLSATCEPGADADELAAEGVLVLDDVAVGVHALDAAP